MNTRFIDLHCHPAMKPYGKSFNGTPGMNTVNRQSKSSIWHYDPPRLIDKVVNILLTLTKFTQADMSTLCYGGAHLVFVSLYPLEKGFVSNRHGNCVPVDLMKNLVMGIGKKRIDHLQAMEDYFTDLQNIYQYYKQLDGVTVKLEGERCRYKMINHFDEIETDATTDVRTIHVVLTIEGANVFNTGLQLMERQVNEEEVLRNIGTVKAWDKRLFFITLAHHFYNDICGHARSMEGISGKVSDQSLGLDTGFTPLGQKVLHALLDNTNQRRVLIDIKHMSVMARNEYYQILESDYAGEEIPLIVSHGAVNGQKAHNDGRVVNQNTFGLFQEKSINFYDDEIVRLARSRGIFGVQLDERRVASTETLRRAGNRINRRSMLFHRSKLIWNQIQHMAEILDRAEMFGWGIQSIGSDFDGLIDPLNGFWGAEQMSMLDSYLEKHAYNYLHSPLSKDLRPFNRLEPGEIVERFMHGNAYDFLRRNL